MHEFSIVSSLMQKVEQEAIKNNATSVETIEVKIGKLSGVEVELFKRAFDTFKEVSSYIKDCKLIIQIQDLVIRCNSCSSETTLSQNVFKCSNCGSTDVVAIDGEDILLMGLTVA